MNFVCIASCAKSLVTSNDNVLHGFLDTAKYLRGSNSAGLSARNLRIEAVDAKRKSVSMLTLRTPRLMPLLDFLLLEPRRFPRSHRRIR